MIPKISNLRFGIFDGDLAVWDNGQAFVLTNGRWYEHEAFVMWHEARINVSPGRIAQLLKDAPQLPKEAFGGRVTVLTFRAPRTLH